MALRWHHEHIEDGVKAVKAMHCKSAYVFIVQCKLCDVHCMHLQWEGVSYI